MSKHNFIKMNGIGNDFVIFDARVEKIKFSKKELVSISDRHRGVGCDQVIIIEPSKNYSAAAFMRIFNADGSEVMACGNATRCVALLLMTEKNQKSILIETASGILEAKKEKMNHVTVNMGLVKNYWKDIPLSKEADTLHINFSNGPLKDPVAVNIGNPHVVFFVKDVDAIDLKTLGKEIEYNSLFPEKTNVEIAQIISLNKIRLRVWERGVGITQACGTGACAALIAANRRNLTKRKASIVLDGGLLEIEWLKNNSVTLTGPVEISFTGTI